MKEAILLTDGYKLDHRRQYPEGTEYVYSNWTPRSCHYYPEAKEGAVVFGIQYFIKEYLMKQFQEDFFNKPKDVAVAEFKRRVDTFLGPNNVGTKHIEELHDLGYLPIRIKALPEGTKIAIWFILFMAGLSISLSMISAANTVENLFCCIHHILCNSCRMGPQ